MHTSADVIDNAEVGLRMNKILSTRQKEATGISEFMSP